MKVSVKNIDRKPEVGDVFQDSLDDTPLMRIPNEYGNLLWTVYENNYVVVNLRSGSLQNTSTVERLLKPINDGQIFEPK